jgi:MGT family glycosyltransferase
VIGPDLPPYGFGLPPAARRGWKWRMGKVVLAAILRSGDRSINRVRGRLGLPSRKASFFSYSPYLVLGFTTEAFEYSGARLPSQVYLVGPSTSKKRGDLETDFPWEWLDGKPALYATLGTLNTGRTLFYEKVIEACRGEPWQMVVSTGRPLSLKTRDVPENVLLREYVPQPELLSRLSGVICHGGNVTVAETLSAGLPLVVVPIGADQPEVAQRVVEAGAGLRLGMRRLTVSELRRAMHRLLEDSSLKANAGRIAEDYGRCDGPGVSAALLARLAEERVPILRGPECRATVYAGGAGDIFGDQSG